MEFLCPVKPATTKMKHDEFLNRTNSITKGGRTMEIITAEQAAEAAKGLTFEKVWAALMETRKNIEESNKRIEESNRKLDERMEESNKRIEESNKRMEESSKRMDKKMNESYQKTKKLVAELTKNIGGLGNSLGRLTEALFSPELCKKFNEYGFTFKEQANSKKIYNDGQVIAEVDSLLENGEYVMLLEIKTEISVNHVDDHLERIMIVRRYMDEKNDHRILVGAVAGGIVSNNVNTRKKRAFMW